MWTRQNWQIRACFSKKFTLSCRWNLRLFWYQACFSRKFPLVFRRKLLFFCRWNLRLFCVFQGNLHLFSMEFVLTFQRTLHLFRRWNLHVFFVEIRASFLRDEICVSFFVEFFTSFLMKFSFVGFKKLRFLAIILKNMRDMRMNPSVKLERIELSIQLWGLYGASTRSDPGILILLL